MAHANILIITRLDHKSIMSDELMEAFGPLGTKLSIETAVHGQRWFPELKKDENGKQMIKLNKATEKWRFSTCVASSDPPSLSL